MMVLVTAHICSNLVHCSEPISAAAASDMLVVNFFGVEFENAFYQTKFLAQQRIQMQVHNPHEFLWFKTFNPNKNWYSAGTARSSYFCACFLSTPFSFDLKTVFVRPYVFFYIEQRTFINLIYVCAFDTCGNHIES